MTRREEVIVTQLLLKITIVTSEQLIATALTLQQIKVFQLGTYLTWLGTSNNVSQKQGNRCNNCLATKKKNWNKAAGEEIKHMGMHRVAMRKTCNWL
jgi:hypothetical protein